MTTFEHLEQEAYDLGIVLICKPFDDLPDFDGLFLRCDGYPVILINTLRTKQEQTIALREELEHFRMDAGDILDQSIVFNRKAEAFARSRYYNDLLPLIKKALLTGCNHPWEVAEETDIPEPTINEIIQYCDRRGVQFFIPIIGL